MYGGVVIHARTNTDGYKLVTIRSWTKWNAMAAGRLGFEIFYGHLDSYSVAAGDIVKKGQVIGLSGTTGTWTPHLHVGLRAFNENGVVPKPHEDVPAEKNLTEHWLITAAAERIRGRMNFACFLPADNDDVPAITQELLTPGASLIPGAPPNPEKRNLLSIRTALPFFPEPVRLPRFVPVYTSLPKRYNGRVSPSPPDWLPHSKIGCYVILGEQDNKNGYKFYWIQWKDNQQAWVPYKRKHFPFLQDIEAVQVEEASTPALPSQAVVHIRQGAVEVYPYPYIPYNPNSHLGVLHPDALGQLRAHRGYVITGTHLDRASAWPGVSDSVVIEARRRWWRIDYNGRPGWVRSDKVNEAGPTSRIARAWPPAPGDLQAEIRGRAVQVSWVPDPALADAPAHLQAAGYRVWRMEEDSHGKLQLTATQDVESAHANDSGQRVEWTDAVPDPRPDWFYYQVATRIGATVGPATALVSASTAPRQSVEVLPPGTPTPMPPGTPTPTPPDAPVDTTAPPTAVPVTLESTQGSRALKMVPGGTTTVSGFTLRQGQARDAVNYFHARVGRARQEWLRLRQAVTGQATPYVYGWVPLTAVEGGRDWKRQARLLPQPPFVRVAGTGTVPVREGPATGYTEYLTQIDRDAGWQAVLGKNGSWWQIRADARRKGWVPAALVDETGDATGVPFVNEAPPPVPAGPGGTDAPSDTATQASGHYLNLANSWQGAWSVSKSGTDVTAAFQSTRSPVQYLARQHPADLLVLPAGFRPTRNRDIKVTGVHVTETGVDYDRSPTQSFTLRVSTTGAVRYKDGTELDHVGYLRYEIGTADSGTTVGWQTATAATPDPRPSLPDLSGSGTYHNQQENWGSSWSMEREGDEVEGRFATTRSPVEYFANRNREALVWLPREYWPEDDERFQVKGAVRVNADGTDSSDTRTVDFWITVRSSDGRMYYDRDATLTTAGVGHLRYSINVDWDASPR
ncbi:MAG: M23 family metallopeptidase, partial [Caldilineaceae bacterium]|nr:M23 family metallopeptidase [Caldilineaceae bacterium]